MPNNNLIDEFQRILRGKNGTIFFVILALVAVMFFFNVIPALIKFVVVGGIVFLIFRYFEKKN